MFAIILTFGNVILDIYYYLATDVPKYFVEKSAEKLREKVGSVSGHRREHLIQVQEELMEMNDGNEEDLKEEGIIPKWNDNSVPVLDKNLNKQHSEVSYEQQQHGGLEIAVSSVLSLPPVGNMTVISDDDDENDEFYDASSDFNDVPLSSATITTVINTANIIPSTIASQNGKIISFDYLIKYFFSYQKYVHGHIQLSKLNMDDIVIMREKKKWLNFS